MARLNFLDFSTLWVAFGFRLFQAAYFYKYSTASEQPGFLLFRCKRKHYFKILRKIEKIKMRHSRESNHGSPAFRASALTFRLPWHVIIFSILAPYGLLSAFAFFKQRIFINIQQLASNQDFSFFGIYIYIYINDITWQRHTTFLQIYIS